MHSRILTRHFSQLGGSRTPTHFNRFYENVSIKETTNSLYEILLDGKTIKTPARMPLQLPNQHLAQAIAWEWQSQKELVRPNAMPLMAIAATTIDVTAQQHQHTSENILQYLHTDNLLFLHKENEPLYKRQVALFQPLLDWFCQTVGPIKPSESLAVPEVSEEAEKNMKSLLESMKPEELTCLSVLVSNARSLVTGLALMRGVISVERAAELVYVEENLQREEWGVAEGDHDVDFHACICQLHAARMFYDLWKI